MTDYVNEEIRLGRMSRETGIALVSEYDDACAPDYIESFCAYIGVTVEDFWKQVRRSANRDLFDVDATGRITRKYRVGFGL